MSSTALDIAARELAHLRRENAELRQLVPPQPPALSELRDGQEVTEQELRELYRAQRSGALKCRDGELREVFVVDQRTGRRQLHFFGDPAAVWDCFTGRRRRVVGFDTKGGKVGRSD